MNDERLSTPISPRGLVCPRPINRSGHSRKPPGVTKYQNRQQEIDRPTPDQLIRSQPIKTAKRCEVSIVPLSYDEAASPINHHPRGRVVKKSRLSRTS